MPSLNNLAAYGLLSTFLLGWAVLGAFRMRSNFFSAAVYLSKSNACMLIMWNFGVFCTIIVGKIMQKLFFGPLRMIEVERLNERAWFAVTETLLALTIFREEFDTSFVALFISLLVVKIFHWLASDRVEFMEQTPNISKLFHFRMVCCLSTLWAIDTLLLLFAAESILIDGPSVMIMFASEYLILMASIWAVSVKYLINIYDSRRENWEAKSLYVFYVELIADFMKLVVYCAFFSLILTFYGLPLNTLRDLYMTARSFVLKCRDLVRYKQATKNMDERYPSATHAEMEKLSDKTCIICREDMEVPPAPSADVPAAPAPARTNGPNETPKKLPCGHIFHFHCLRSWLERQQSCPTCRHSVLQPEPPRPGAAAPARPPQHMPADIPRVNEAGLPHPAALFNVVGRGPPRAQNATPGAATPERPPSTARRHAPSPLIGAKDTNPLVRFKTPLIASNSQPAMAVSGFADALKQHMMPSSAPAVPRPSPAPVASTSTTPVRPAAHPMQATRSSPLTPTAPSFSAAATNGTEDEAARQRRDRAAAAAARIPRLSPSKEPNTVSRGSGTIRRTASDSGKSPSEASTTGLGFLPSLPTTEKGIQGSDLPRLIPLFDIAGAMPDFAALGVPTLESLLPRSGEEQPTTQLAPVLQAAKASLDRCRAEVDACLQRIHANGPADDLDSRIEALVMAREARSAGKEREFDEAMAAFEALNSPRTNGVH